ncbi:MAG: nucleoside hydrolase [Anaerolineae bacterium]|nr:nucleoside hydrolase [Anaerolineae bacterium]
MLRLVIDTDAGVDDAQAIMMALAHPGVQVEAITTVTGNVHVDKVVPNVLSTLAVMNKRLPVYRGAERPLIAPWSAEEAFHGSDGLGGITNRPAPIQGIEDEHAVSALIRLANEYPGELTLLTLGPMTNIALALRIDPSLPSKIKQLVWMGGTIRAQGNTQMVTAEWNIFCDPEAAYMTLDAFPMSTMLSWETTLDFPFTWDQFDALCRIETPAGRFFNDISANTADYLRKIRPDFGYLLPDPLSMAVTLEPDIVQASTTHYMSVELNGSLTRGQTVIDYIGLLQREPNVRIVTGVAIERVYALYEQMLRA